MNIAIPTEIKAHEGRVALTPQAVMRICQQGHRCYVQAGAGLCSGYADKDYIRAGAAIMPNAESVYRAGELIIKVKEPIAADLQHLRSRHTLFCFLHLAANLELQQYLQSIGLTAIAFETLSDNGKLPLLAPMSEIAGRVAIQAGTHLLHSHRGILLGGIRDTDCGTVTVIGAGNAGQQAIGQALALGARVNAFDINPRRLKTLQKQHPSLHCYNAHHLAIQNAVRQSDLVIGAVLVTGAKAPILVEANTVSDMPVGSVLVDIAIDQGGCIETMHPTDYDNPTFEVDRIIHMAVTNLPGAVPRTASQALSQALLPYALKIAENSYTSAIQTSINVQNGAIIHPALMAA